MAGKTVGHRNYADLTKNGMKINNLRIVLDEQSRRYVVYTPDNKILFTCTYINEAVKKCEACTTFLTKGKQVKGTASNKRTASVTVQLGDEAWAVVKQAPIVYTTAMEDELDFACWKLIKAFAKEFGVKLIDEDGEPAEISFDLAKELGEVVLKQYERAGIPIVRG